MTRIPGQAKGDVVSADVVGIAPAGPLPERATALAQIIAAGVRVSHYAPALTVALAAVLALRRLSDADTWWHLAAGRWIVENRSIPRTDTLSYSVPDQPWMNLQWLFDVFVYGVFRTGGAQLPNLGGAKNYALLVAQQL
jgi:hypothetical protein